MVDDIQAVYDEFDAANRALMAFQVTNIYALITWPADKRLEFDRAHKAASDRWARAYDAKLRLIQQPPAPEASAPPASQE